MGEEVDSVPCSVPRLIRRKLVHKRVEINLATGNQKSGFLRNYINS